MVQKVGNNMLDKPLWEYPIGTRIAVPILGLERILTLILCGKDGQTLYMQSECSCGYTPQIHKSCAYRCKEVIAYRLRHEVRDDVYIDEEALAEKQAGCLFTLGFSLARVELVMTRVRLLVDDE